MEYIWTRGFVKDLALANKKVDNEVLYSVCAVEASYNKEETLALYSMVKEEIRRNHRSF